MRKETQAKLLTGALLVGVVAFVAGRNAGWELPTGAAGASVLSPRSAKEPAPRDAIYAMLDAARDGDVAGYIDCYAGEMTRRLEQSRDEMTPEGFAKYLRDRNREIKGIAINEPEQASDTRVRVRVEYVYADRNEAQLVYLEKVEGAWKIVGLDSAERVPTLVPYGAPVY
ncbi:MAG: hypothetical protein GC160_27135 [Acidobacteria bacterium]|nr:hypothetical protein [Acidobacteriota bacterium]